MQQSPLSPWPYPRPYTERSAVSCFAIGDVQGCYQPLQRLLAKLRFDPSRDTLWFTGDLVNRGPQSAAVLRLVKSLGNRAITVLGNHDLTLLAVAAGYVKPKRADTFSDVLQASDADDLLHWLRQQPLLHHDAELGFTLVHAGLAPQWDLQQALSCSSELENTLRGPQYQDFLAKMFGQRPRAWRDGLSGIERLRFITNCCTRIRYCQLDGSLEFDHKGPLGSQPETLQPWFRLPQRRNHDLNIVFGHWAALGVMREPGLIALDSGCVWKQQLTAVQLDDPGLNLTRVDCR